jgi:hypothetical protein
LALKELGKDMDIYSFVVETPLRPKMSLVTGILMKNRLFRLKRG